MFVSMSRLSKRAAAGRALPALVSSVVFLLLLCSTAAAQPISPRSGGPFPEYVRRVLERDPHAFTFSRAWTAQTERLKENRRRIASGELDASGMTAEEIQAATVVSGTRYVPVFLGKFSYTGVGPIQRSDLQTELFDGPWPTGTMKDYYTEISYGNIALTGTVYDWVTTAQDGDYYAGGASGLDPASSHTGEFITEILTANDAAVNFGNFDNDGPDGVPNSGDDDGYVDFVAIVHPEVGAECDESPDRIWSHRWVLDGWDEGEYTTNDARAGGGMIKINDYTIMPALSCDDALIQIGVFCHEFGHAFGLPDLYDTDTDGDDCLNDFSEGIGHWCLMAGGNWNTPEHPAHMSAWAKSELGWINPGTVAFNLANWPLLSSSRSPTALKMWSNGTPGSEYFLVEYRTRHGFDDQLHAEGMLIWHVDENKTNNKDECHKWIDLECEDQEGMDHSLDADDLDQGTNQGGNRGDAGDPFCDGDVFDERSQPSSVAYNGVATTVEISGITGCGTSNLRANFRVGQKPPDVDLCMRDCGADVCTEPSPCSKFWASPEIYIDNNMDGIIDPPAEGIDNQLFARVRNIGLGDAADVDARFYFADPSLGLLFPSTAAFIGSANIPLIASGGSELAQVLWNIPLPPPDVDHYCIGVVATNAQDGQIDEFPPNDDNVANINIQELYAKAGDEVPNLSHGPEPGGERVLFERTVRVMVTNPSRQTCQVRIRFGSPPQYNDVIIPADWTVTPQFTQVTLPPGGRVPLRITVRDSHPVHMDRAVVPLTALCNNETPLGGTVLTFEIDNVEPVAPCGFEVTQKTPPRTDYNPGEDAVEIRWDDSFVDALRFPERVERWRIYRGTSQNFLPTPANMIAETCIDEDPRTRPYEHYADASPDPDAEWYKMTAVDRAGNVSDTCVTRVRYVSNAPGSPGAQHDRDTAPGPDEVWSAPNPFREGTEIGFRLPSASEVEISIFTLDGRLVRDLAQGPMAIGEHRVYWDGRDSAGHSVSGGVYAYRISAAGMQKGGRILRLP